MNKVIVPTGYMGSGSSVVTDLIAEFEGYESANGSFEYVFLHCPNGVFRLWFPTYAIYIMTAGFLKAQLKHLLYI